MLTLACNWGCKDCCRGLENHQPADSHVTPDQIKRFIAHLKAKQVVVRRLKINGGDPLLNPDFEELMHLFAAEKPHLFNSITFQTSYPARYVKSKFQLPDGIKMRSEPLEDTNYKSHHVPWFTSPTEAGLIKEGDPPPYGTKLTGKACPLQRRCGRSFERWGFMACAQEGTLGRMLGIVPHTKELKLWGDPDICKHCPMCLEQDGANDFQRRAAEGEFNYVSKCFDLVNLKDVYAEMPETQQPW
jgi:hypothetical protein